MPKNKVSDPITDQEIAFARLVLSGTMTDQRAGEAVGLSPNTAAYIKSKPRVRAYMLEHRTRQQQQLVEQETEGLRRLNLGREQVLARLWEIANMSPERTRGSITGQVKVLSMIVAIEGLIPDRRAGSAANKPVPLPTPQIYQSEWLREQKQKTSSPQPDPALAPEPDHDPDYHEEELAVSQTGPAPGSAADAPPNPRPEPAAHPAPFPGPPIDPGEPAFADGLSPSETPSARYVSFVPDAFAPGTRDPFSIPKGLLPRRR
jgi:hypothetical protein